MKKVAVVGAVVAGGALAAMAIVAGTASADVPGDCSGAVTLLAEPGAQPGVVVAECEPGPRVQLDEIHDGLRLPLDLPGLAAQESVPSRPGSGVSPDGPSRERYGADADSDDRGGANGGRAGENADDTAGGSDSDADPGDSTESPERGGVG